MIENNPGKTGNKLNKIVQVNKIVQKFFNLIPS